MSSGGSGKEGSSSSAATAAAVAPGSSTTAVRGSSDAAQWAWPRRGGMRGGYFPHGPRPPGPMPYMRPGGFFRLRMFPMHHPFPPRKPMPPGHCPPGWSGVPPHMIPPPYMSPPGVPPPGVVPPGAPVVPSTDPYHMVQPNPALAWPVQAAPTPTSTTEDDPTSTCEGKKKKRAVTNSSARPWNREAAEKALAVEHECQKNAGANAVIIRFPDPDLTKEIVQGMHSSIENVHFQSPCGPRYCFVTVDKEADVDNVIAELNKIKFGTGYLKAERKVAKSDEPVSPESIDPFTLYVGNLPTNISTVEVKEKFQTATRIDIGYAQKLKYTRYAFVRYATAKEALESFKASVNTVIASRSIILRFRRHKGPVGPKGERPCPPDIETKPGEKLNVGAKLKAMREKMKAEKEKNELSKPKKKKIKLEPDDSSHDEEVELENDEDDSDEEEAVYDDGKDDDDDDDDDDNDDDDDGEEDDYDMDAMGQDDDPDDDVDDDVPVDDDDDFIDDDPDVYGELWGL